MINGFEIKGFNKNQTVCQGFDFLLGLDCKWFQKSNGLRESNGLRWGITTRGATQLVEWEGKSAAFFTFDTPARYKRHVHTYVAAVTQKLAQQNGLYSKMYNNSLVLQLHCYGLFSCIMLCDLVIDVSSEVPDSNLIQPFTHLQNCP